MFLFVAMEDPEASNYIGHKSIMFSTKLWLQHRLFHAQTVTMPVKDWFHNDHKTEVFRAFH